MWRIDGRVALGLLLLLGIFFSERSQGQVDEPGTIVYGPGRISIFNVPIGKTRLLIVDGGGFGNPIVPSIEAHFTVPDPAFAITFVGCYPSEFNIGGTDCILEIGFTPTVLAQRCATIVSHLSYPPPFGPGGQPGMDVTTTVQLCGTGAPPVTPQPQLNLAVSGIQILNADPTDDGLISVKPGTAYTFNVAVSGTNFNASETRTADVALRVGSQVFHQGVSLALLKSSGSLTVPFSVTLSPDDAGSVSAEASINSSHVLLETSFADNQSTRQLYALCNAESPDHEVQFFAQGQEPWREDDYDHQAPDKMRSYGCLVSALAMVFDFHGISTARDGTPMTPGSVNKGLSALNFYDGLGPQYASYNGYTPTGAVQANGAINFARQSYTNQCVVQTGDINACFAESLQKISFKGTANSFTPAVQKEINRQLCKGNPVILKVPSMSQPADLTKAHFVVAKSMTVQDGELGYSTHNPGRADGDNEFTAANSSDIRGYRLYTPTADPAMIFVHLSGATDMVVTDPMGRRAGFNSLTQQSFNEIPGGTYVPAESISSPDDPNLATKPESRFEGLEPIDGEYQVEVFSSSDVTYRLTTYSFDTTGTMNGIDNKTGLVRAGTSVVTQVQQRSEAIPIRRGKITATKALNFSRPKHGHLVLAGRLQLGDAGSIPTTANAISVGVGSFGKTIESRHIRKVKIRGKTHLVYLGGHRDNTAFEINTSNGEFILHIDKFALDGTGATTQSNVRIQIDGVSAESIVTFTNKRKHHHEK